MNHIFRNMPHDLHLIRRQFSLNLTAVEAEAAGVTSYKAGQLLIFPEGIPNDLNQIGEGVNIVFKELSINNLCNLQ